MGVILSIIRWRLSAGTIHRRLSTGQGLEDEDLIVVTDGIGEVVSIGDAGRVDVDGDVPAHASLVVENVGAQAGVGGEYLIEHGAHGVASGCLDRAGEVPLEIGGECNARHAAMLARERVRRQVPMRNLL
jgi:hypothetical protein